MNKNVSNSIHVAIACGGTGGHLFPGIAVAEKLVARGCSVALLVSPKEVDQQAVKSASGMEIVTLPAVALQRGSRLAFFGGFWNSLRASRNYFKTRKPHAVLAMGGFTSAPPVLAAKAMGAKTFLHESNSIPGRANRWLARFVDEAFVGFPEAAKRLRARRISITGTPVRAEFQERRPPTESAPTVLIMGGSQGASGINDMILSALPLLSKRSPHWRWVHLTGPADFEKVKQAYAALGLNTVVKPFLAEMDAAMREATAAVSRAGASSLAEIAAVRLPSLLVPYPFAADNHQWHNARAFAESGAARLLEQKSATPEKVVEHLVELVKNQSVRTQMQNALAKWHAPKAAEEIAEIVMGCVAETESKSSKLQAPSSREISSSRNQTPFRSPVFGVWMLALLWSLVLGIWSVYVA